MRRQSKTKLKLAQTQQSIVNYWPVSVHLYDLTGQNCTGLLTTLLGNDVQAIYHASVVVYHEEYWFGGKIFSAPPLETRYGEPIEVLFIGETRVGQREFHRWLNQISPTRYSPETYDSLEHNCITFADEALQFLCGQGLPAHVRDMCTIIKRSPLYSMLFCSTDSGQVPETIDEEKNEETDEAEEEDRPTIDFDKMTKGPTLPYDKEKSPPPVAERVKGRRFIDLYKQTRRRGGRERSTPPNTWNNDETSQTAIVGGQQTIFLVSTSEPDDEEVAHLKVKSLPRHRRGRSETL